MSQICKTIPLWSGDDIMTQGINHQSNYQKLTAIVNDLIDNNHLYQENLDRQKMIEVMKNTFGSVKVVDVNSIAEEELRKRIKRILSLHLVSGMLNDFTPEQMSLFDESVKRGS